MEDEEERFHGGAADDGRRWDDDGGVGGKPNGAGVAGGRRGGDGDLPVVVGGDEEAPDVDNEETCSGCGVVPPIFSKLLRCFPGSASVVALVEVEEGLDEEVASYKAVDGDDAGDGGGGAEEVGAEVAVHRLDSAVGARSKIRHGEIFPSHLSPKPDESLEDCLY